MYQVMLQQLKLLPEGYSDWFNFIFNIILFIFLIIFIVTYLSEMASWMRI